MPRSATLPYLLMPLCAFVALGQLPGKPNPERVYRLEHAQSKRDLEQIGWIVSGILAKPEVVTDSASETLTVRGMTDQLALAEWVIAEFDQPIGSPRGLESQVHEFKAPSSNDDMVRVIYLKHIGSVYDLQEIATAFNVVAKPRWIGTHNTRRALIVRGTADQVALVQWLASEWDSPAYWQSPGDRIWIEPLREYRMPDGSGEFVRMFYLNSTANTWDLQEMNTVIRTKSDTNWVFPIPNPGVIVFRGAPRNVAMGEWLFNELNRFVNWHPTAELRDDWNAAEYLAPEYDNHVVRVFYLPPTLDPTETLMLIRKKKWLPYTFVCTRPRAFIMRGTREDTTLVEQWLGELIEAHSPAAAR